MADIASISHPVARARAAAVPTLAAFVEAISDSALRDPEEFWCCEQPLLDLANSRFVSDVIVWELECLRGNPDYVPSRNGESDFEILRIGSLSLNIRLLSPLATEAAGEKVLYGLCEHSLNVNLGPGLILIERWRQESDGRRDVLDRNCQLMVSPSCRLGAGAAIRFEAHRDVVRYGAIDRTAAVLTLRARECGSRPIMTSRAA